MSRRSGQCGYVCIRGKKYVGRYRVDVPGQNKRVRRTVIIGNTNQFTKSQAKRWLMKFVEEQGVNDEQHLARSQSAPLTFGMAARGWRENHLIVNKKRSSQRSMTCELNKHILPQLKDTLLHEITYPIVRSLVQTWNRDGLSRKSVKNLFGITRAVYNFQVDEIATRTAMLHDCVNGGDCEHGENAAESRLICFGCGHRCTGRRVVCSKS